MARRGRKQKKNPATRLNRVTPSRRPSHQRMVATKEHTLRRIDVSGNADVPNDYPLDVLQALRKQDLLENGERMTRGETLIPPECLRGIDEFQHAAGWNLWRLRWQIQGEVGSLPNSVDKRYARLVAPADDPEPEERRAMTEEEREDMITAARHAYNAKLRALDRVGWLARRVVLGACIEHEPCQMPWKLRFGDKRKLPAFQALILGLEAIGAAEYRELDRQLHKESAAA